MILNKHLTPEQVESLTYHAYNEYKSIMDKHISIPMIAFDNLPVGAKEAWVSAVDRVVELAAPIVENRKEWESKQYPS